MQNLHNVMRQLGREALRGVGTRRRFMFGGVALAAGAVAARDATAPIRVAAASDLKFALPELLAAFERDTGLRAEASYGSSGNFARQIRQGLPVQLFMSADEGWVQQLADAGLTRRRPDGGADRGVVYAQGHLALYVSRRSTLALDVRLQGVREGWDSIRKFAIANPELAPYGRAAREALQQLGLWELAQPKLVLGENIAQATQFVATGAAEAGITSLSLASAPELAAQGRSLALPGALHAPILQRMVLLRGATAQAERLYDYLQAPAARALLRRHGLGG